MPRKNGEVIIGSTIEFIGHNKDVSLEAIQLLAEWADTIVPGIGKAPLSRFWAGLRPYSPTRRPILCRAPSLDNVVLATGHHRNGILLAPITGQLISELITAGQTSQSLEPFGLPAEPVSLAEPGEALGRSGMREAKGQKDRQKKKYVSLQLGRGCGIILRSMKSIFFCSSKEEYVWQM